MKVLSRYHWIAGNMTEEERESRENGETRKDRTLGNKHIAYRMDGLKYPSVGEMIK